MVQRSNVWAKVKRMLPVHLPGDEDKEGCHAFTDCPPTMVLERTIDLVGARNHAKNIASSRKRMDDLKSILKEDFNSKAKACWNSVREPRPSPVNVTHDVDNGDVLTADPKVLHSQLWKAWEPIFRRPSSFSWEDFEAQYRFEINQIKEKMAPWSFSMPTGAQLQARANKMPSEGSTGPDGRAPSELKRLPLWLWNHVARFWEGIYLKGGEWPQSLLKAHVAFIPKAGGLPATPVNLRPITILSASYRVFSSCMFRQLLAWHDQWCPSTLCGGRPGADALQTAMELGLTLEEALAIHKRGLLLISLDLSKFFDSLNGGCLTDSPTSLACQLT